MEIDRKMTDNERISKWRGECRHVFNRGGYCNHCHKSDTELDWGYKDSPRQDYSGDPSAWTPKLFERIRKKKLWEMFSQNLYKPLDCSSLIQRPREAPDYINWHAVFALIKATPAQKASALARAIEGVGGG